VKRSGVGSWALVALVFGATLVVARRVHDGVASAPVPAPVAEVADSPVAGALPDVRPSATPAPTPDFVACVNLRNIQPHGCTRDLAEEAGQQMPTSLIDPDIPESVRRQRICALWVAAWDQAHCP